jgi:hypothetical protein
MQPSRAVYLKKVLRVSLLKRNKAFEQFEMAATPPFSDAGIVPFSASDPFGKETDTIFFGSSLAEDAAALSMLS